MDNVDVDNIDEEWQKCIIHTDDDPINQSSAIVHRGNLSMFDNLKILCKFDFIISSYAPKKILNNIMCLYIL